MSALETRNEAYFEHRDSGKLTAQQQKIVDRIKASNAKYGPHDFSLQELSANTGLPINVVSGRVHELKERGVLVECMKRKCKVTKKTITPIALAGTVQPLAA